MNNKQRDHDGNDGDGKEPVKEPPPNKDDGKDLTIEIELPRKKPDDSPKH